MTYNSGSYCRLPGKDPIAAKTIIAKTTAAKTGWTDDRNLPS